MTERSLIRSHLCPAAHNGSSLKFTALAFERESNMLDGQLAHLCGIKAICYEGRRMGDTSRCVPELCLCRKSLRCLQGRCDLLLMNIRLIVESVGTFNEVKWLYAETQNVRRIERNNGSVLKMKVINALRCSGLNYFCSYCTKSIEKG